jgi:prepilin-type N-terminal cleavage/methylation domain-containing protein
VSAVSRKEDGYTLIELLMAMAVFSFMLVIIVAGFINIVRLHNASVATNIVQDNAQTIMASLERVVRNGTSVDTASLAAGKLCVDGNQLVALNPVTYALTLTSVVNCITPIGAPANLMSSDVKVFSFVAINDTPLQVRPTIRLAITVGSANGTVTAAGANSSCGGNASDRAFCAVSTITGAATPRSLPGGGS